MLVIRDFQVQCVMRCIAASSATQYLNLTIRVGALASGTNLLYLMDREKRMTDLVTRCDLLGDGSDGFEGVFGFAGFDSAESLGGDIA